MDMRDDLMVFAIAFGLLAAVLTCPLSAADGMDVYNAKCKSCHGEDGRGKAAIAKMMKLDMAGLDLTDAATTSKKDADWIKATEEGVGKMKGYKDKLSAEEIKAVVAYMRGFSGAAAGAGKESGVQVDKETVALYGKKCASCHGKDGKGNEKIGKMMKLEPAGLDLTDKATVSKKDAEWIKAIEEGAGKMKEYKKSLSSEEIKALVGYMRTFK